MTSEKRALVLELGSRYVRAGIAEERAPRFMLRWEVAELLQVPRSAATWRELLYPKLHALCFESMLVNPSRRRVILCEDLLCPRTFREALLAIFFTDFKVASVTFVPSVVTALYATSNHTALVIDCGWSETRVLPIFKGFPLQYLYRTIPNGSKNCCDTIQREVGGGVSVVGTEMAEDILERACFAQQKEPIPAVVDAQFQMNTSHPLLIPAHMRTAVVESLFKGDTFDSTSIAEGVRQIVKQMPVDVRASALGAILLIGGTSMIPGFATRLLDEIREALSDSADSAALASHVNLVPLYFPRNMLAWVGASVFAATEKARSSTISANEYASAGPKCLPDWLAVA